ncbi:amidohydrolase family protein [Mycobacterium branderi]|uniref:Amidohydrolase n=1 Tax=Mycobacterium branderi TaxID=43348 RepID=A0A7I7W1Z0_9MYCO|nr:amidohydrolase family protein [Mycobacterium branderi]MCV7235414.1 amidohydrolase [Mycobacterium branderi]ORA38029.1 amidohydrolase [Mycobacterium branderi]BBZ10987.1 amidohydrolase [Mycobacterium branderi]
MADEDEAASVRQVWSALDLPGVIDVHTHFMPKSVMDKVWNYFDSAGPLVGRHWPITYRADESRRVAMLRQFGVRGFTALVYPHKPQMAAWLNQWAAQFARSTPDCLATATFYPEPDAADYVETAIRDGTRVFKAHIQVGRYEPNDPLLDRVWGLIEDAGVPVVIHCGSGPVPGEYTGPEPIRRLLRRYPRLRLIVAHMGMPEYAEFLNICESAAEVRLDTTMAFTPFTDDVMPFPPAQLPRLRDFADRILFGSDFPNIPHRYADAMRWLTELPGIDDTWLRAVFYENAATLFFPSTESSRQ